MPQFEGTDEREMLQGVDLIFYLFVWLGFFVKTTQHKESILFLFTELA